MQLNDMDCYYLWWTAYAKVDGNYLFKARAFRADPYGNPIRGAYNHEHGDMYVRTDLFASNGELLNTVAHESAHPLGYRDDGSPPTAQDRSDQCVALL